MAGTCGTRSIDGRPRRGFVSRPTAAVGRRRERNAPSRHPDIGGSPGHVADRHQGGTHGRHRRRHLGDREAQLVLGRGARVTAAHIAARIRLALSRDRRHATRRGAVDRCVLARHPVAAAVPAAARVAARRLGILAGARCRMRCDGAGLRADGAGDEPLRDRGAMRARPAVRRVAVRATPHRRIEP